MNSEQITKNISSLLSRVYVEIELLSHSGMHDKNIFAENLMLQLFNTMYGYHFVNANVKSRKSNYPGIDLIDTEQKIICQVSSETTSTKLKETLESVQDNKNLYGYHLLFIALKQDANILRKCKLKGDLSFVFSQSNDIYDGNRIIAEISAFDVQKQIALYNTLCLWLGTKSWEELDIFQLSSQQYSKPLFNLPEYYIPRSFSYSYNNETDDFFERILHPYRYESGSLADFVCGRIPDVITNCFVIYSPAQNGKTTELYKLANDLISEGKYSVTYIKASDYNNYTGECFLKTCLSCYEQDAVYLIDALDEVADSKRSKLIDKIHDFVRSNPLAKFVITFRKNYEEKEDLNEFTRIDLRSLSETDISNYVNYHLSAGNDFIQQANLKGIEHLLFTPFFLINLVDYYNKNDGLTSKIVDIYDYVVHKSYDVDKEEGVVNIDKYDIEKKLENVALVLQFSEEQSITGQDMTKYLGLTKSDMAACLRYTVLKREGDDYSFTHNGIKEYFVTRYLLKCDYDRIIQLICYDQGKIQKVRKNWYNVVMFLLSSMDNTDKRFQRLLYFLMEKEVEILTDIDPTSISDDIKCDVLKSVLKSYKSKGIYPSDYYATFAGLAHMCDNSDAAQHLLSELGNVNAINPYTYLLERIVQYIDFDVLSLTGLDKKIENAVFSKVKQLGNDDSRDTYALYEPFENRYFRKERVINKLIRLDVCSIDKQRIRTIFKLIVSTDTSDKYIDFIIDQETNVNDFRIDGVSHAVSRDNVYDAIKGIKSYHGLTKIWKYLSSFIKEEIYHHNDHINSIVESLLHNSNEIVKNHKELLCDIEQCWYRIYDDNRYSFKRIQELFILFRDFMQQYREHIDIVERIKFIRANYKEISHEDLEHLQATIGLYTVPEDAIIVFQQFDSQTPYDYNLALWLVSHIFKEWDNTVQVFIKKTFTKFKSYPSLTEQRTKELRTLLNYNKFKKTIQSIIDKYTPENRKDLQQKIKEDDEFQWSNDVARFMQMSYNWKSEKYNLCKVKNDVQDKDVYTAFLLSSIHPDDINYLSKTQKERIRILLNRQLSKKNIDSTGIRKYLQLAMDLDVLLRESLIKKHIKYAACKKTKHSFIGDDGCFLWYAVQYIEEKTLIEIAKRIIKKYEKDYAEDICVLAKYLIDKREKNSYSDILKLMLKDGFPYSYQISEKFSKLGRSGFESLKCIYNIANADLKLVILGQLYKDEKYHHWIMQMTEDDKDLLEEKYKVIILRYRLAFGIESALNETLDIMKKDCLYFGNFSSAPVLGYRDIKYLPQLEELLKIAFEMEEKYTNWSGVIVKAMKNIAMGSEDNMNTVCKLLSKYTTTEKWLNRIIIEIQSEYYELHYKQLSIKEAAILAMNCQ